MKPTFCVLYRFRVDPARTDDFIHAWSVLTEKIAEQFGGLGSRLHRQEDGVWAAYAQWPSRAAWEEASGRPSPDSEASATMREVIVERLEPVLLEVEVDLLASPEA
jgi:quinol monooxygenase YgiN